MEFVMTETLCTNVLITNRAHHQRAHPVKSFKSNPFPLEQTVPKEHPQTQTNVPFPHWRRSPPSSLCRQICVRQIRRLDYLGI
jgi:hypothetical protein